VNQYRANVTRNARPVELPLEVAPSGAPLRHRVADALIDLLRTGHLRPGDTLPATRTLAAELASHLARAARTYAARRRALIAGLRDRVPQLRISGVDAGLHLVAGLPPDTDEAAVQRRLAAAGLAVDVLGQFASTPLASQALVCGYALLPETQAAAAAAAIARTLAGQ
jgi:GntR family transcriptional regulator / MocR family aminotransferase